MSIAYYSLPTLFTTGPAAAPPTLRLWRENGGEWTELDLAGVGVADLKLQVSYAHPRRLSFSILQPQHTLPIALQDGIVLVDDLYGGFATPLFEGYVHEATPASSQRIDCVAFDPVKRASERLFVHNAPVFLSTSIPRAVYNCTNDNDEDKAFERRSDATIGQIVTDVLSDNYTELVALRAAPPVQVGGPAYIEDELDALSYQPQEKMVLESRTLHSALDRLLDYYPQYRLNFVPGHFARHWHLIDVTASPQITLTLNATAAPVTVLSLDLQRSIDNRWTAVRIYGPERTTSAVVQVSDGSLTEMWTPSEQTFLEVSGPGAVGDHVSARWQVTDPARRLLAKMLPAEALVPTAGLTVTTESVNTGLTFVRTRRPTLIATWDGGDTWEPVGAIRLDVRDGVVSTPYTLAKQGADDAWVTPDDVRLYFAYYDEPLFARFPSSGFSGTAYDEAGIETELQLYDESLAVGYEWGTPVTSSERLAQYTLLAENIQRMHRDVVAAGGAVLDGLQYAFLHLDRRVNFTAVDAAGDPLATGWEQASAVVTDVEYDFSQQTTTLLFSSDQLEFLHMDPESLSRRLQVEANLNHQHAAMVGERSHLQL